VRLALALLLAGACTAPKRAVSIPSPAAPAVTSSAADPLIAEAWIAVAVDDVGDSARAVRTEARARGGKIVGEMSTGTRGSERETTLHVRVPPEQLEPFIAWVERLGSVSSRRIESADAGKVVEDTELALANLELTLGRLRDLAGRPGIGLAELLQLEREMERVRGDIEKTKAEKRRWDDAVAMAAVEVDLDEPTTPWTGSARAKLYPGPRVAGFYLVAADERDAWRFGGGATVHVSRGFNLSLDVFDGPGDESVAVMASVGGALYSDYLGRGRGRFLNPYLGLRMGYGYFLQSHFLVAGEVGLELWKHKHFLVEANVRAVGLLSDDPWLAIVSGVGFVLSF
jgi:Domain of unknown function (DUF4349)